MEFPRDEMFGVFLWKGYVYTGTHLDMVPHGSGAFHIPDIGFVNAKCEYGNTTSGTIQYFNGSVYSGGLEEFEPSGQGVMTYNTAVHEGSWAHGQAHGFGKTTYADGRIVEGYFEAHGISE